MSTGKTIGVSNNARNKSPVQYTMHGRMDERNVSVYMDEGKGRTETLASEAQSPEATHLTVIEYWVRIAAHQNTRRRSTTHERLVARVEIGRPSRT